MARVSSNRPFLTRAIVETMPMRCSKVVLHGYNSSNSGKISDRVWENQSKHKEGRVDIFHMTGDPPMHVVLEMSLMARNLLIEEYPDARKSVIATNDDDKWILDAEILRVEGIGRFYLGLAGEITILEGEALKKYAREYASKHIR